MRGGSAGAAVRLGTSLARSLAAGQRRRVRHGSHGRQGAAAPPDAGILAVRSGRTAGGRRRRHRAAVSGQGDALPAVHLPQRRTIRSPSLACVVAARDDDSAVFVAGEGGASWRLPICCVLALSETARAAIEASARSRHLPEPRRALTAAACRQIAKNALFIAAHARQALRQPAPRARRPSLVWPRAAPRAAGVERRSQLAHSRAAFSEPHFADAAAPACARTAPPASVRTCELEFYAAPGGDQCTVAPWNERAHRCIVMSTRPGTCPGLMKRATRR